MTLDELLQALRSLQVETGNLACLGCGHEHNCGTFGCRIITEAFSRLALLRSNLGVITDRYENARGAERAILGEVLALMGGENDAR